MSDKLDKAREIINKVDSQMAELFVERMKAAEMVYEHKKNSVFRFLMLKEKNWLLNRILH